MYMAFCSSNHHICLVTSKLCLKKGMLCWLLMLTELLYVYDNYEFVCHGCSPEAKPVLEDKLSEFAGSFIAAYDSGELLAALEEGHAGWQKWVKSFGKSLKRKVASLSFIVHLFFNLFMNFSPFLANKMKILCIPNLNGRGNHCSCLSECC